ncbi:sensor histidine kinase [Streptococcus pacificus]|uniref:histidine kinase n=1 Tax=Streptococcus pacificus TaxID=2740577 RepID=A0ABS0ZIJ8_9STRE|nr:sensor histidine kinase [Streptococcus pacificus]MBJ8325533.1 sensor histidine kinase [Streptococcus pacificus]
MIKDFLKEYFAWYALYFLLVITFLITFFLYHLPFSYFITSLLFTGTITILVSIWQFYLYYQKRQELAANLLLGKDSLLNSPLEKAFLAHYHNLEKEQLQELSYYLEREKNLQNLVKMWSHQMKVPLSAISLMTQTNQLNPQDIDRQLLSLDNYVDTLITYLKFHHHKTDFRFERIHLKEVVVEIVKKYRLLFLHKGIDIEISGDWVLKSDHKWLSFAITQLIDNALKYTKKGGKITIRMANSLVVEDTGIGILKEDIPRLFEEGFTGYNGREYQKATGLGLYMTKRILDDLGLTISITSDLDQGTTVVIKN